MQHNEMQHAEIEGFRPSVQQVGNWQDAAGANVVLRAEICEPVDAGRLRQALESAVARHEILRTRLHVMPGMQSPVQVIGEEASVDWREADAAEQEPLLLEQMGGGLACAGKPQLAAALVRHGPQRYHLLLAVPAAIADAATLQLLLQEVQGGYRQTPPEGDCLQYADFAEWQHEFLASAESESGKAFWRGQDEPTVLKARHPFERRGVRVEFAAACLQRRSDALLANAGGGPAATVAVCWGALLQRQLGLPALVLGWRHDGRNDATRDALGPYAKTLPLLLRQDEALTVRALVQAQHALQDEAALCQESFQPGDRLPYVFEYRAAPAVPGAAWRVDLAATDAASACAALWLTVTEADQPAAGLLLALQYDEGRFAAPAAELLLEQFATLLEQACRRPEAPLRELDGVSEQQLARLAAMNRTGARFAGPGLLHQLFEANAARRPQATAVAFGDQQISYGELNARANRLAHRLRQAGVRAEQPVGLYAGRCIEAVAGMLAILKAGGVYLPLDPSYPVERLAFMLEDTSAALVLSTAAHAAKVPQGRPVQVLLLDDHTGAPGDDSGNPPPTAHPGNLAYIIYTSGSTGKPKGVAVGHLNAVQSTMARWQHYDVECESFLLSSSFSFDSSIAGLFWTLSQGGKLCLPADEDVQDAAAMARLVERHAASHLLMLSSFYGQVLEAAPDGQLNSLKCAIVAGEAGVSALAARHRAVCPQARLYNEYGPTEGTVWCTLYEVQREDEDQGGILPIGGAIANARVYVLDKQLAPVPQGVAGEIAIGGAGIVRGYLRRPALTAERFVPDPFGLPGARLYRTGDIGRFDADGCLEFLGRADHQVKLRGYRIELGEIEARLAAHGAVSEAAVVARTGRDGDARLVAYVVLRQPLAAASTVLQQHLKQDLPEHMVPAGFVVLDAMPLSPNGKLDRAALPEPGQDSRPAYVAPRNDAELLLAQVWEEILGAAQVGLDDDFFALGGHSLVATRLVSRVRSLMGRAVSVRSVFQHPRLGDFARHVQEQAAGDSMPLAIAPRTQPIPLSFPQLRLWQFERAHPHSTVYNVPNAVRLLGELERDAMQRAFDELVRRHEALRTTFIYEEALGMPVQSIQPAAPVPLRSVDFSALDADARAAEVLRLLSAEEHMPFDLARGPLLRAGLVREGEREHTLWITLHHIVSDRWSMQVLVRELAALYEAFSKGQPSPLPEPAFQYADFAVWQRQQAQGAALQRQLDFWKSQLSADQPPLHLPGMRPRAAQQSHRGDQFRFHIRRELAQRIQGLCRSQGATLFMTMLAAFKAVLALRSGEAAVPVGILLANRNRLELEGLTGCLINMQALRTELTPGASFEEYLGRVRETVLAAQANQDVPFEQVVQALQPAPAAGATPLFQVLFDVHSDRILQQASMGGLTFADAPEPHSPTTHFDLMVGIGEREDGMRVSLVYCTDLFDEELVAGLALDLVHMLELAVTAPHAILAA